MERKKVETQREYIILAAYGLFFIVFGFLTDTPRAIAEGLYQIISEPDILITDYFGVGGIGASFVNLGIIGLISIGILYALKINVTGASISAIWLMFGFALFGKDILNIWVIIGGVWLYSRYQKESFARYVYIALFGTSLAPIVTLIIFQFGLPYPLGIPLGILIGVGVGFILPPLAGYMMRFHQGFNLYNIGFTAGIIGTVLISLFKSFGFAIESRLIWTTDNNSRMALFLEILLLSMIVLSFILDRNVFRKYRRLFQYNGRLVTDFVMLEGFAPTLLNMGINGSVATLYVLIVGGALNGPTIGGILTIVGFSAFGKHLKNIMPIFVGVALGSVFKSWSINDPSILLAALFGTTLAPISGTFGWKLGILAGFLHSSVVLNVGVLHGGVNLYNNGFAGGIVAATLIPLIEAFRKDNQ